jgi:transposase
MALTRDHARMEKRRVQAAAMFEKGTSAPEVGRRLGVSRQVAYRWKAAWEKGGKAGLTSKGKAGRKSKLTALQTELVVKALVEGPVSRGYKTNLWTLPRVATLIKDLTGVQYHPGHVWRLLGDNGFSCQRPERLAIERDEPKIRRWKRVEWPAIKKSPQRGPNPRLHRRKRTEHTSHPGT